MIIIVALIAVWIIAIARAYWADDAAWAVTGVSPNRLAAIVTLMEEQTPDEAALLLAISSRELSVTLASATALGENPVEPLDARRRAPYEAALGNRAFTVGWVDGWTTKGWLAALPQAIRRRHVDWRVALRTGGTAVIEAAPPRILTRFGLPVGLGAGLVGTLIALLALVLMHHELRPLVRLAAAADSLDLSAEPRSLPVPRYGAPEIVSLVRSVNRLQTRLATLIRARMAMIGGISHDVRTFVTRLRLRVETLEGPERDRAIRDIEDLVRMLDDALIASRAGAGELSQELFALDGFLAAEFRDRCSAGAPVTLTVAPEAEGAQLLADPLALRRVTANLIDNALAYGRTARVHVRAAGDALELIVDDAGPGIPAARRALLLEPFVRLDGSRSRATGGAGLGLSVVKSLVEAHGGSLSIADAPSGGTRIIVRLNRFLDGDDPRS